MQALWLIILAIFGRRRPAMAVEANLVGILQKGLDLFEDEDARCELEDSPAARAKISAALLDAHRKVDLLIYLRALKIAGLPFLGRAFQSCRHPYQADRSLGDLWRRFHRLILRFEDAERCARLSAARLRRKHDEAIPAARLAAALFTPDHDDLASINNPVRLHAHGGLSRRSVAKVQGSCASSRGPQFSLLRFQPEPPQTPAYEIAAAPKAAPSVHPPPMPLSTLQNRSRQELPMTARTLREYLADPAGNGVPAPRELSILMEAISDSCRTISYLVSRGHLADVLGSAGTGNVQGEEQKQLDVLANDELMAMAKASGVVAAAASEEEDHARPIAADAPYLLLFDPLDGSSNIDVNVSIGTIFSVLPARAGEDAFLQTGRNQIAAGYCVYGPQTTLVLTLGVGVAAFTMDPPTGQFVQTGANIRIPEKTKEFAINMSNMRHWDDPVRAYIDECLAGEAGPRGKNFNMRWIASMVADVHRVLSRGGVFMYPWDRREPNKAGKLRLMYEANPMSLIIEQAGGKSFDGKQQILDVQPTGLHQRVSVMLGSKEEVEVLERKHAAK